MPLIWIILDREKIWYCYSSENLSDFKVYGMKAAKRTLSLRLWLSMFFETLTYDVLWDKLWDNIIENLDLYVLYFEQTDVLIQILSCQCISGNEDLPIVFLSRLFGWRWNGMPSTPSDFVNL